MFIRLLCTYLVISNSVDKLTILIDLITIKYNVVTIKTDQNTAIGYVYVFCVWLVVYTTEI